MLKNNPTPHKKETLFTKDTNKHCGTTFVPHVRHVLDGLTLIEGAKVSICYSTVKGAKGAHAGGLLGERTH